MRPTILAFFLHDSKYGEKIRGDERRFLELGKEFRKLGVRIYTIEHVPLQEYFLDKPVYSSVMTNAFLKSRSKISEIFRLLKVLTIVVVTVLRLKFDLIYVHNQDFENVLFAFIAKILSRKPLVIVIHFVPNEQTKRKQVHRAHSKTMILARVKELLWRVFLRKADACIAVSRYVAMRALEEIKLRKVYVCGNGVDLEKFRSLNLSKIYDVAFLGRLDFVQKGIDTLLKAWVLVCSKMPDAKLIIVGGGSEEAYNMLKQIVDRLGLSDNVIITGFAPEDALPKILNMSKIFVFPSRFEGFGLAVLEAMACGLPCVLSNIEVFRELYNDVAIFVEPDDYRSLALTIIRLLKDEKFVKRIGERSREHAPSYTWTKVAMCELKVLYNVLKSKGRGTNL